VSSRPSISGRSTRERSDATSTTFVLMPTCVVVVCGTRFRQAAGARARAERRLWERALLLSLRPQSLRRTKAPHRSLPKRQKRDQTLHDRCKDERADCARGDPNARARGRAPRGHRAPLGKGLRGRPRSRPCAWQRTRLRRPLRRRRPRHAAHRRNSASRSATMSAWGSRASTPSRTSALTEATSVARSAAGSSGPMCASSNRASVSAERSS
jgi:hypothetical protein